MVFSASLPAGVKNFWPERGGAQAEGPLDAAQRTNDIDDGDSSYDSYDEAMGKVVVARRI